MQNERNSRTEINMTSLIHSILIGASLILFTTAEISAQRKIPKHSDEDAEQQYDYKNYTNADTIQAIQHFYADKRQRITGQTIIAGVSVGIGTLTSGDSFPLYAGLIVVGTLVGIHQLRYSRFKQARELAEIEEYNRTGMLSMRTRNSLSKYLR